MIRELEALEGASASTVGGKALGLMRLAAWGFLVPDGFVLETGFFAPWVQRLAEAPEAVELQTGDEDRLGANLEAIRRRCGSLSLDPDRRALLQDALSRLRERGRGPLFAVRSSSPEEDLENASFAGAYESVLAVPERDVEAAVRTCFASCFDERLLRYRVARGLAAAVPRIAVVVQELVDAEVAGVAFSLNPLTNCYDEVVVDANHGLAQAVVAGAVEPDSFVYDKVSRRVVGERIGRKQRRLSAAPGGGLAEHPRTGPDAACLSGPQVAAIADLVASVEARFGQPVDVEWALLGNRIHLLQARPITTWLPIPRVMVTEPGAPKRLYSNSGLIEQGLQEPLSVLGTDFLAILLEVVGGPVAEGAIGPDALVFAADGGYFTSISHAHMLGVRTAALAPGNFDDPLVKEILEGIDMRQYTGGELPPRLKALRRRMLGKALPMAMSAMSAVLAPRRMLMRYQEALPEEDRRLAEFSGEGMSLRGRAEALAGLLRFFYGDFGIPMILAAQVARRRISALFRTDDGVRDHLVALGMALEGNKTTEMGEELHALADSADLRRFDDPAAFAAALESGSLDPGFDRRFRRYVAEFGMRCPREIDPATPRPGERPGRLFTQLKSLAPTVAGSPSPLAAARSRRERAYRALLEIAGRRGRSRARTFEKLYQAWLALGGYRETPKHYAIKVVALFRRQALDIAAGLVAAGRLDAPERIFDLAIDDVDRGLVDPSIDLRALARERSAVIERIRRSRHVARVIDSRGRILHPPRREGGGSTLSGIPISPGTARGRVNVLTVPDEKPLLRGEILVARATDPGWTPLFLNAAAVVLEIGGALQHGAVVAREYGVPCVSGVEGATERLRDGQLVEVDGSSGTVRVLEAEPTR